MKRVSIKFFRIFFPLLFIVYVGSISLFIHSHVINGVTIVHSHFYKMAGGKPQGHHHSQSEVQFIHNLSTILIANPILFLFILALFLHKPIILLTRPPQRNYNCSAKGHISLRAPPTFI